MSVEVKGIKTIKEDNFRLTDDGTVAANSEEDMYEFGKTVSDQYKVKQEECIEVLKIGVQPDSHSSSIRGVDYEKQQWNVFKTESGEGKNTLPFNIHKTFEEEMMDWGYRSYLSKIGPNDSMAPTWKMSEGDTLYVKQTADSIGISSGSRAVLVTRRYKRGSTVDFKHFHQLDGGLKSIKKYHNDDQLLASTTTSTYTSAWTYSLLKNEMFKYLTVGVYSVTNLVEAKIMVDNPEFQYNEYFVAPTYNQLPYVDTCNLDTGYTWTTTAGTTSRTSLINQMIILTPSVDVVKGVNKTLDVLLKDGGSSASNSRVRFTGVRINA